MSPRSRQIRWWLVSLLGGCVLLAAALGGCPGDLDPSAVGDCPQIPDCEVSVCCEAANLCVETACQGLAYTCGQDPAGTYAWRREAPPCDDGDPCTQADICFGGRCTGAPMACDAPPKSTCVGDKTLQSFAAGGTCNDGQCDYPAQELPCATACSDGVCVGEPCLGVTCNQPPGPCYQQSGTCADGVCSYERLSIGEPCQPDDPCILDATCKTDGSCVGTDQQCRAANASLGKCVNGVCIGVQCNAGFGDCDNNMANGCETDLTTVANCGGCGKACAATSATASCTGGACTYGCEAGFGDCDNNIGNGCEKALTTTADCGGCGKACSAANATASCTAGACKYTCKAGYGDCDGNMGNGCEKALTTTADCGGCGRACSAANATASCTAGACKYTCKAGYGDCDGNMGNGCERALTTTADCGGCGKVCPARANSTPTCSNQQCRITCTAPWQNCDGSDTNGCEIPVGQANVCDKNGLNVFGGCGTAHCGSSSTAWAANFGSWTCTFCSQCHMFSDGGAWCLYNSASYPGQFASARCSSCCGASARDLVCAR